MLTKLRTMLFALLATLPLHAAQPGKPQQLTSPDQTPEGLEKPDGASF